MGIGNYGKSEDLGILVDRIYGQYSRLEQKLDGYKASGFMAKHVLSLPCRMMISRLRKKVVSLYRDAMPLRELDPKNDVVVSLTSFPPRMENLHMTIKSLFRQTVMPCKIVLWLSADEFPRRKDELPETLLKLTCNGLDIRFVSGNIRSHKKYFYAFKEFTDSRIVTVDDDVVYPADMLERLVQLSDRFRNSVCANIFRQISMENNGFAPYKRWTKVVSGEYVSSCRNTAIGCGGVLYPPHCFSERIFDMEAISEDCQNADDLWLKANELMCGIDVAGGGRYFARPIELPGCKGSGLQRSNNGHVNMNDIQWNKLCSRFGLYDIYVSQCRR